MYNTKAEILEKHEGSFKRLFEIYQADNKFYSDKLFLVTVCLSFCFCALLFFSNSSPADSMIELVDIGKAIIPNLLGFNLGAYILVVGFGGTETLSKIITPLKEQKNFSLYQKLNGVLGVSVLVQIFALFWVIVFSLWFKIEEGIEYEYVEGIHTSLNYVGLFLTFLIVIYSFLLLISVAKQVFIFAQTIHFTIHLDKMEKKNSKQE